MHPAGRVVSVAGLLSLDFESIDLTTRALLVLSAVVPSIALLLFFYLRDAYPEPPRVVLTTFLLGVAATLPILGYIHLVDPWVTDLELTPYPLGLAYAYVLAALPEELLKFAILMLYVRRHSAFDEPMDGLVYGASASLGFATLENLIYVDAFNVALTRALTAVPCHAAMGVIMGCYIAEGHFEPKRRVSLQARGLVYMLLLHGAYNTPLLTLSTLGEAATPAQRTVASVLVIGLLVAAVGWAVWLSHKLRRLQRLQAP